MAANAGFAEYHGFAVLGHDGVVAAALQLFERVRMGPGGLAAAGLGRGNEKGAGEVYRRGQKGRSAASSASNVQDLCFKRSGPLPFLNTGASDAF